MLGKEICRRLKHGGEQVRALVRTAEKAQDAEAQGLTSVLGDLKDPASLPNLVKGAAAVVSTASATISRGAGDSIETVDRAGNLALAEAARRAGVTKFVFISIPHEMKYDSPLDRAKREVEAALKGSGMDYTILNANMFMEVWLGPHLGFDYPNARARIYGEGRNPISWVSYLDVAALAVESLARPAASRRELPVGGPEALSPLDVVKIFENATRRQFAIEHVPEQELRRQWETATEPFPKTFAALMLQYANGWVSHMSETLEAIPLRLRPVREYARAAAGAVAGV